MTALSTRARINNIAFSLSVVIAGHSRPKDGVASLAYDPAIHRFVKEDGCAGQARA